MSECTYHGGTLAGVVREHFSEEVTFEGKGK